MSPLPEFVLHFDGFAASQSWCHLLLDERQGVVLGELDDNPGTSLTNALELACAVIADRYFDRRTDFMIFEWLPHDLRTREPRLFEIKWHAPGFRLPEWTGPTDLPPFASHAEEQILRYQPYTAAVLHRHHIRDLLLPNSKETLAEIQKDLPPAPPLPDRPPQRREQ